MNYQNDKQLTFAETEIKTSKRWGKLLLISGIFFFFIFLLPMAGGDLPATNAYAAALSSSSNVCQPFVQVNESAFGLGSGADGTFNNEEGYEVVVFKGQLYLGMEADNSLGARIWRTKAGVTIPTSQANWEEVAANPEGDPFGVPDRAQNDHIDSLAEFNGYLYASTANREILGTRVFRSPTGDPGSWEDAIAAYGAGFGDPDNMNFKDMQVFQGWLCGGTQNWRKGAQVWCTQNGTTWIQKNVSGFGKKYTYMNREIWSGYVFNGGLYFGVQNLGAINGTSSDDVGKLYRTTDLTGEPKWEEVYSGEPGSFRVDLLGELNGDLYISVRSSGGIVILRSPDGKPGTWIQVNQSGMDGNPNNFIAIVDSAILYNEALYVGVSNTTTGFELWRTRGELLNGGPLLIWEKVNTSGLGDPKNIYTELTTFEGGLFAWTSNHSTGQQVLRSECSSIIYADPTSPPSASSTPTPTASPTISPTATSTDPPNPTATPTATPEPTPVPGCPTDNPDCQQPIEYPKSSISIYLPVLMREVSQKSTPPYP